MASVFKFKNKNYIKNEIRKERLRRLLESDLVEFCKYFFEARGDKFIVNSHHEEIREALKEVETGSCHNLLINMPPRYGKTEEAVIGYIAQSIAINTRAKFIHLSYSDDLALENSARIRELILSDEFQELWTVELKEDSNSKKKWYTRQGGGLYATSAGGAVTGFGAGATKEEGFLDNCSYGAIIIDDPLKVDDADSEKERNKVNSRLNGTIKSRRNSRTTPIIIIMQRLHAEDMSGFVLDGGMGEKFIHLNLTAIKDDGTALWAMKHTVEELEAIRGSDPYMFSGQYQQMPSPVDGEFFKRDNFKRYRVGDEPRDLNIYGASDFAVSKGSGDFTEHGVGGFDSKDDLYFIDWYSKQESPDVWISELLKLAKDHDPDVWVAEGGAIRRSIEPFLSKEMRIKRNYFRMEWITSNKDKQANAKSFQALASQGKVWIPKTDWGNELIEQLIQFPNGKWDDKVDVCGLFGRILNQTYAPDNSGCEDDDEYDHEEDTDAYGNVINDNDDWRLG